MKNKRIILITIIVIIITSFVILSSPKNPFQNLKEGDVVYIEVSFGKLGNHKIDSEDKKIITDSLSSISLRGKDDAYTELSTQDYNDIFILYLKSGEQIKVEAMNPYIIINDVGYKCENYISLDTISEIYEKYLIQYHKDSNNS